MLGKTIDGPAGVKIGDDIVTERQRSFADAYLETGNAAEAARRAGYAEGSARQTGGKILTKSDVKQYMADRLQVIDDGNIASTREALIFLSEAMRGRIKDQFGLDPSLADRTRAAVELLKRLDRADGQNGTMQRLDGLLLEFRAALAVGAGDDDNEDAPTGAGKGDE